MAVTKYEWNGVKHKDELVLVHIWPPGHEIVRESGCIAPRILMLLTVWRWVVSFKSWLIYASQKFLPYPPGQKQLENLEFLNYLCSVMQVVAHVWN